MVAKKGVTEGNYCSKPPKFHVALFLCSDSFSQDGYIVSFVTQKLKID